LDATYISLAIDAALALIGTLLILGYYSLVARVVKLETRVDEHREKDHVVIASEIGGLKEAVRRCEKVDRDA